MTSYIKGGILGGIIIFIWSALSWMVLPWHMQTLNQFANEKAVADAIVANATQSGMYLMPLQGQPQSETTPMLFASVHLPGMTSMVAPMAISLFIQVIAAMLVGWMLSKTVGLSYWQRVGFVVLFALAAGILIHGAYWNWFAFDIKYTLVAMGDLLIGWFFAGLVLAKFVRR